jgi:hypothetical protein
LAEAIRALPITQAWKDIQRSIANITAGWLPVPAFRNGNEVVVLGSPSECDDHDCDIMGCGFDHVLARFTIGIGKE